MANPLNPDSLNTLYATMQSYYGDMRLDMLRQDAFYNRDYTGLLMTLPANIAPHRSSTPTIKVDAQRDQERGEEAGRDEAGCQRGVG